jgi:uncharacterized protein YebE (UPF0316 family)
MEAVVMTGGEVLHIMLLGALIFAARICDVSLGTMRISFISRGHKILAPIVGFFEVLIWLVALRQIMANLTNAFYYVSYAGGFAMGTFVGMCIEERMAIGNRIIRVITRQDAGELIVSLRDAGYGVTSIDAQGVDGHVHLLFSIIKRQDLSRFIGLVEKFNPRAFYSIEDVRFVSEGIFPAHESFVGRGGRSLHRMFSKRR